MGSCGYDVALLRFRFGVEFCGCPEVDGTVVQYGLRPNYLCCKMHVSKGLTETLDRKSSGKVKVIWAAAPEIGSFTAPSAAFSSASPLAMPSCNRIRQGYDDCDHRVDKYEFCGGSHEDTNDAREACYKAVASGPGTSQNPPNLPGKCPSCEPSQTNGVSSG